MENLKLVTRIAEKDNPSYIMGHDDGTISSHNKLCESTGIESPVHLYAIKEIAEFKDYMPTGNISLNYSKDIIYEYETKYGMKYEFDKNKFKTDGNYSVYDIIRTTDPKFPEKSYGIDVCELWEDMKKYNEENHLEDVPINKDCRSYLKRCFVEQYEETCNNILMAFCEKHGYDYKDAKDMWVANEIGTICCIGDMYVNMYDMYYDLKNNIPADIFEQWYWDHQENCNYKTYSLYI